MIETLKTLCALNGVSGDEDQVREFLAERARPWARSMKVDPLGNLIVWKKGARAAGDRLMLCAHMDEVGLIVTHVTEEGFLKFDFVGGVDRRVAIGKPVVLGPDRVPGVVGIKAIHLVSRDEEKKVPKTDAFYLDIGARDREEALSRVEPGTYGSFVCTPEEFGEGLFKAKAIDDRVGCAVLLKLLEEDLPMDVVFVFTAQEEVGTRGAFGAAFSVAPETALVLETTTAADLPGVEGHRRVCAPGRGPVISYMDGGTIYDRELFETLRRLAGERKIPWQTKEYIAGAYGEAYICPYKRTWKTKSATAAQDAHEAIRPSVPSLTPDEVDKSISGDTAKLYRMIWSRFMASQMADCQQDTVSVTVSAADYHFKASGYTVTFDGFTALYEEATDEKEKKETNLPPLEQGQVLKLRELKSEQKFTQPPARYTEATLIKALEENGIGRPSTYAPIITTIIDRGYVERDQKKLKPTLLGRAVDGLMLEQFPHIVDVDFSAQMEKNLDKVESGKADWRKTVDDFYQGFEASLEQAEKNMEGKKVKVPDEPSSEVCDLCGRPMVIKVGKYGKFLACSGFPECRGTKRLVKDTGGICPKCGKGRLLERKSSKGRIYYGCERYPDCDFMTWDMPVATKCEKCGSTLFRKGGKLYCAKEGCGFEMPVPKKD